MAFIDPFRRVQRLRKASPKRKQEKSALSKRTPPGQYLTEKFPVLTYGKTPKIDLSTWKLRIWGLVENPVELDWQAFQDLPTKTIKTDIHCVTRWSKLDTVWRGVPFPEIAKLAKPLPEAKFVMEHAYGGYTTNMRLEELMEDDVLLATHFDDKPLTDEHGGPMRMLVPKLYFWKSAKWLNGLEFRSEDLEGFWEHYGYHMHGDPWKEERFRG